MSTIVIVSPPSELQHRAWECAYSLREDYIDRLGIFDCMVVAVMCDRHPLTLVWADLAWVFSLYRETVEARV